MEHNIQYCMFPFLDLYVCLEVTPITVLDTIDVKDLTKSGLQLVTMIPLSKRSNKIKILASRRNL